MKFIHDEAAKQQVRVPQMLKTAEQLWEEVRRVKISRTQREIAVRRRIALCRRILALVNRSRDPKTWARATYLLASDSMYLPSSAHSPQQEKLISRCKILLESGSLNRRLFPKNWRRLQGQMRILLGRLFLLRVQGVRSENCEQAIRYLRAAVTVGRGSRGFEEADLAEANFTLALAYRKRIRGQRGRNVRWAVNCLRETERGYTRRRYPVNWAITQRALGWLYSFYPGLTRTRRCELAIQHEQRALQVIRRRVDPVGWAELHQNLGWDYWDLFNEREGVPEDLEDAYKHFRLAMSVYRGGLGDAKHRLKTARALQAVSKLLHMKEWNVYKQSTAEKKR